MNLNTKLNSTLLKKLKGRKIILASSSPRRSKLLKTVGLRFKVIKSNIDENLLVKKYKDKSHRNLVKILSFAKASYVVRKYRNKALKGSEIILGFDTMVVCKNKIIDKPRNKKDALKKLLFLSGKEHKVYGGVSLLNLKTRAIFIECEVTKVFAKKIDKARAIKYINSGEPFGKAGAYAIQGKGKQFIKQIKGDYFNVVGLPLDRLIMMLRAIK